MASVRALAVVLALAFCASAVEASQVSPMEKVLQMMAEMRTKGEEEKNAEEVTFTTFAGWCTNTAEQRGKAIRKGARSIERLTADIAKYDSDVRVLGEDMQTLDATIDKTTIEKNKANKMRNSEHTEYEVDDKDLGVSIGDATRAKEELKRMMASVPSLLQVSAVFDSELQTGLEDPNAPKYESKSGQITQVIEQMEAKFHDEKDEGWEEEAAAKHAFAMMEQTLTDEIEKCSRIRNSKASTKKEKEAASAEAQGDLAEATATHADDVAYLADLKSTCEQKTKDFEARQELRAAELEAIDKAKEILQSIADKASLAQRSTGAPVLAQLRNGNAEASSLYRREAQSAAAAFLQRQGRKFHSNTLSLLSVRVSEDPFRKVTKMIKDMIFKLQDEAGDEAEHKGFCDAEMATNKQSRDTLSAQVEEMKASIEGENAKIAKLATDISQLTEDVAELDGAIAKATEIRVDEKAKNTQTIADAKEAVSAVEQAISVLKDFYAKAAGATALVQASKGVGDDMPETFDKPYTGMEGGGVMGMLEVCLSDYQRLSASTEEAEQQGEDEFTTFSNDSSIDKAEKATALKMKDQMRTKIESRVQAARGDLEATEGELKGALDYFDKLKPSCVDTEVSYEERVANRKDEIASLKQALQILSP